jgi:hypothetical protein
MGVKAMTASGMTWNEQTVEAFLIEPTRSAGHDDVGQAGQRVAIATVLIVQWRLRPALGVCGTARSLQAKIKQQRRGLALTPA